MKFSRLRFVRLGMGAARSNCHGGAEEHLAALVKGSGKPLVSPPLAKLRDLSAEQASNFCGRCHRTWSEVVARES